MTRSRPLQISTAKQSQSRGVIGEDIGAFSHRDAPQKDPQPPQQIDVRRELTEPPVRSERDADPSAKLPESANAESSTTGSDAADLYSAQRLTEDYVASLPTPPDTIAWGSPEHIAWDKRERSLAYFEKTVQLKRTGQSSPASGKGNNPYSELENSGGIFNLIDSSTAPNAQSEEELIEAHRAIQAQSYLDKVLQLR